MTPAERKLFHSKVMIARRSTTASHYTEREAIGLEPPSDQQLLDDFKLLAPQTMVAMARVNLFIRVVVRANPGLRRAIHAAKTSAKSWLAAVEDDFKKLRELSDEFKARSTMQDWIQAIRYAPNQWKRRVTRVLVDAKANQLEFVASSNVTEVHLKVAARRCAECGEVQPNTSAKAIHEFKQHWASKAGSAFR